MSDVLLAGVALAAVAACLTQAAQGHPDPAGCAALRPYQAVQQTSPR